MSKFSITPDKVSDVRKWFRERGGVWRWTNKEIGNNRPDVITPQRDENGKPYGCPHWAYVGQPEEMSETELEIRTETVVPLPPQWFPVCNRCNGTGKRSLEQLAFLRTETLPELLEEIKRGNVSIVCNSDGETFDCNQCEGTGHCNEHGTRKFYVAIRRKYYGLEISETGKERGRRIARKLAAIVGGKVEFDWQYIGYGLAELRFYTETVVPFSMSTDYVAS